jgi:DNA polymerase I-like protein with 3'-5' exonuclease and polymerase domains
MGLFALIKKPKGGGYWLLDLIQNSGEDFLSNNKQKQTILQSVLVCLDVKETFNELSLSPSPHFKVICLVTFKKLAKNNPHEVLTWPELSSTNEAILWCKQALEAALLQIEKLNINNLCKVEFNIIMPTIAMERLGLPFNKERWRIVLDNLLAENQDINNRLKDLVPSLRGFLLFEDDSNPADNYQLIKQAETMLKNQSLNKQGYDLKEDEQNEIASLITKHRENCHLMSLYGDDFLLKATDRIFGHYNCLGAITGRFSCHDTNLLALPNYQPFQDCIRPKKGRQIIHFDYNAFEIRILAALSKDSALTKILEDGHDIHSMVAEQIFNVKVSKTENVNYRDQAKVLNFGIIYGMGEKALALKLNVSLNEARELLEQYFKQFVRVKNFLLNLEEEAKDLGYVKTALNRRGYINKKEFNNRVARNFPIQGSGADIIKLAMCLVYKDLNEHKLDAHIINVVHDELVIECDQEALEETSKVVRNGMEKAFINIFQNIPIEVNQEVSSL